MAALAVVPVVLRTSRRREAALHGASTPAPGSPAQVWISRGERVARDLDSRSATYPALGGVASDAADVVGELHVTGGQVAELDRALAAIPAPALARERDRLAAAVEAAAGQAAAPELARSLAAVTARLAAADRQRAVRDSLVARMESAVTGLEQARDELAEMISGAGRDARLPAGDPQTAIRDRLAGLRVGLAEVRRLSDPGRPRPGSGSISE